MVMKLVISNSRASKLILYQPNNSSIEESCQYSCGSSEISFYWPSLGHVSLLLVQSLVHVQLFATPWTTACQDSLSITTSQSLLKLMFIELVMSSNHLILCYPLLFLPSSFPSIRVFSNESSFHIRWPKYCSFSISPPNEYSGLISFRIVWSDLLAVQGTLEESSPIP